MEIIYYGTGDGYGIPEPFCSCRLCSYARAHGGRDIRTRSQAVIDDIMIDCSADLFAHQAFYGLDMRRYRHILITHGHSDHYAAGEMTARYQDPDAWHLYMPSSLAEKESARMAAIQAKNSKTPPNRTPEIHAMQPFETRSIGDYRVTALPSHHSPGTETLLYIVQHAGKTVFWVHDSGLLRADTIDFLRKSDFHFDAVSMDCTLARGSNFTSAHMDILQCCETAELLRDMGRIDACTVLVLSHIGHLIDRTHDELSREAAQYGFIAAYDTMRLVI